MKKSGRECLQIELGQNGEIFVLSKEVSFKRDSYWKCQCKCGEIFCTTGTNIKKGRKGCKRCRPINIAKKHWKGFGEISGRVWNTMINGAKSRNLEVSITIEDAWNLFIYQNRKCALSGIDLIFNKICCDGKDKTASLDRIDSSKGYIKGNIQWIHKDINQMKMDLDEKLFMSYIENIYKFSFRKDKSR